VPRSLAGQSINEGNVAILYVLWTVGLSALIAISFLSNSNVSYTLSRSAYYAAQRQAAAEAAAAFAVLGLLDPRRDRRWRVDGIPQDLAFGGYGIRISVQDELGRIDINQADQPTIIGLLGSVGLTPADASSLADKMLDWRDASPARRLNGAKDSDYRAAGYPYGPRNGPFQSLDELQLVMGFTEELFRRIEPAITVYSGRQFIDPQFAPREVLLALPTMSAATVDNLLLSRRHQENQGGVLDPSIQLDGRAFTVRFKMSDADRSYRYEIAVRLTGQQQQPFWLLSWKSRQVLAGIPDAR